jgi:hypothetical protein
VVGETRSRLLTLAVALLVVLIPWTGCLCQRRADSDDLKANGLATVRGYSLDYLSGSMALHALDSVLRSQGVDRRYAYLVAMSGAVFKFVYDSTEAYEPLRDTCPLDLLRTAAVMNGFPNAHWETGLTLEGAKRVIKREIDAGRPLISPFLVPDAYHGLNIITGYDYEHNTLSIQGAFDRRRPLEIPMPESWDGPTLSPAGWATNPLFVLGRPSRDTGKATIEYAGLLEAGIAVLEGGKVEYGVHDGERQYMQSPGPHQAWYGLPAYPVLVGDIEDSDLTVGRDGRSELNFGLIWRIDAMVGLLEHDRRAGSALVEFLKGLVPEHRVPSLLALARSYEKSASEAAELRSIFWHQVPDSLTGPQDVLEYTDTSGSMIFALPQGDGLADSLRGRGWAVYDTLWGSVLTEDSPDRRLRAKIKAISLMSRDREALGLLKETAGYLRIKAEVNQLEVGHEPLQPNGERRPHRD